MSEGSSFLSQTRKTAFAKTQYSKLLGLFPAVQKTTWLSSLKICEKNNAENEKLNVFLQAMDILDYLETVKFVK